MVEAFAMALKAANRGCPAGLDPRAPRSRDQGQADGGFSSREQAGAGLDALAAEEFARFTKLNTAYKDRFGFPFIFAVKGATKQHDSRQLRGTGRQCRRKPNSPRRIAQICRIFRFRIEDRVAA